MYCHNDACNDAATQRCCNATMLQQRRNDHAETILLNDYATMSQQCCNDASNALCNRCNAAETMCSTPYVAS